jgi:2'-5' RNA ligase
LAETGLAPYMHTSGNRPHLTLAIYQELVLAEAKERLTLLAATSKSLPITFSHIGLFPTPEAVVFVAPRVTSDLLELHSRLHDLLADIGRQLLAYYLPGQWCRIAP